MSKEKSKRNKKEKFCFVLFIFSAIYNIAALFVVPPVKHMPLDIITMRFSVFMFIFLAITIPTAALANVKGVRYKLPLFKKNRAIYSAIAIMALVIFGFLVYNLSELYLHSEIYKIGMENYSK
ncbi:MAG: hypothetical protein RR495_06675 [Anaerovoracaceae bacterium]